MHRTFVVILFLLMSGLVAQQFNNTLDKNAQKDYTVETVYNSIAKSPYIEELIKEVSKDSILATLKYLDDMGVKNAGSATLDAVGDWLREKLIGYGYEVEMQDVTNRGSNVIIEKKGAKYPDKKVIVGGHYDSVTSGPGVNDNGSGTATLLEIARILKDRTTDYSLILVWFTAEEVGLLGSKEYVKKIGPDMDLLVMFNIDMIGGVASKKGMPSAMTHVTCEEDRGGVSSNNAKSKKYTDTLVMVTNTYTSIKTKLDRAYGSDYLSFESKGYTITGYYEYVPGGNPYYHKPTDLLKNMDVDYATELTKGALAFAATVSRVEATPIACHRQTKSQSVFSLSKIGSSSSITLQYHLSTPGIWGVQVFDITGREVAHVLPSFKQAGSYLLPLMSTNGSRCYIVRPTLNDVSLGVEKIFKVK